MTKIINYVKWSKHTIRTLHLNIMQFLVAHKFVGFVFVSKHCKIWLIVENGVTDKEIFISDYGDVLDKSVIS